MGAPLSSTLMWLQLELLEDGKVVHARSSIDPDEAYGEARWSIDPTRFLRGDIARRIILREGLDRLTVRVRGMKPPRTSQWHRSHYWSGEYVVPLQDVLEPECGMRPAGKCGPEGT